MPSKMVRIPRDEYRALLEEVGILRNEEMMRAITESEEAKKRGQEPHELHL